LTHTVNFYHDKPLAAGVTGACMAGALSAIITHPVDTAKTKIQADMAGTQYPSAISAMKQMWKEKGMFRGALPRTMRICGAFFICMSLRDVATDYKTRHYV
jgi:4-hydroxy-L-threonine phosphate dehydrogenase PdxA